jgi:putative ABC transport system ATP-binding protein
VVCRRIRKSFGLGETATEVLRGVDLEIRLGELSFLVGPSGCGKTTLLSVITGLLGVTEGSVQVLGQDIQRMGNKASVLFRRRNIGFVFQQYNLLPALSAAENVAIPLLASGAKRKRAVEQARLFLATLGLRKRADALPKELSGGEQQRVALARALIHEPRLLVCDEPTAALDADTGRSVMELLRKAAVRDDRAVIVVTHDSRVFEFADSTAYMNDGRIVDIRARDKEAVFERQAISREKQQ